MKLIYRVKHASSVKSLYAQAYAAKIRAGCLPSLGEYQRYVAFEQEGACAALQGSTREDCPYVKETQRREWDLWVYGCERAIEEMMTLKSGKVRICQLDIEAQLKEPREYKITREWEETAEEAYRNGNWKPRYVCVPKHWRAAA